MPKKISNKNIEETIKPPKTPVPIPSEQGTGKKKKKKTKSQNGGWTSY